MLSGCIYIYIYISLSLSQNFSHVSHIFFRSSIRIWLLRQDLYQTQMKAGIVDNEDLNLLWKATLTGGGITLWWYFNGILPSGKHRKKNYGESPFVMGKATITGHFHGRYASLPEGWLDTTSCVKHGWLENSRPIWHSSWHKPQGLYMG